MRAGPLCRSLALFILIGEKDFALNFAGVKMLSLGSISFYFPRWRCYIFNYLFSNIKIKSKGYAVVILSSSDLVSYRSSNRFQTKVRGDHLLQLQATT